MKAIMAMDENRAIGKNGKIPWKVSEDFKWFKEFTMGKNLIVGHSTFVNLPKLIGRNIFFISRPKPTTTNGVSIGDNDFHINSHGTLGRRLCYYQDALNIENAIIAGGAKTYELFLPYLTEFYVTHIKGTYDADTYMIPFEHLFDQQELIKEFDGGKVIKYARVYVKNSCNKNEFEILQKLIDDERDAINKKFREEVNAERAWVRIDKKYEQYDV